MPVILTVLHVLIFVAFMVRVLSRSDLVPTTRVAWILVLLAIPVVGLLAYLYFGEVLFRGEARRAHDHAVKETIPKIAASGAARDLPRWGAASGFATAINGFGVTEGNRGELLDSPQAQRERLLADLEAAEHSIDILYYIWLDDGTGRAVADALTRAAGRGVRCRAAVDAVGSRAFLATQTWKDMNEAGVKTAVTLPLRNPLITMFSRRLDLRNHRKITVVDGKILHCGSQNCADPEFRVKPRFAPWIDIMVRFEGPIANQMQLLFMQDWLTYHPEEPETAEAGTMPPGGGGVSAQVVGTGPSFSRNVTAQLFTRLIVEAKRELIISTPYFVPGEMVATALMSAAFSGVEVRLIVPRRNDSRFVSRASRSYYPQLVRAGVRIVEFNGGLLHAKTLTIDGEKTFIGSSNMDIRSFDLNFENDVLFADPTLTAAVRARQVEYIAASTPVDPIDVLGWSTPRRIMYNAFAVAGPLL